MCGSRSRGCTDVSPAALPRRGGTARARVRERELPLLMAGRPSRAWRELEGGAARRGSKPIAAAASRRGQRRHAADPAADPACAAKWGRTPTLVRVQHCHAADRVRLAWPTEPPRGQPTGRKGPVCPLYPPANGTLRRASALPVPTNRRNAGAAGHEDLLGSCSPAEAVSAHRATQARDRGRGVRRPVVVVVRSALVAVTVGERAVAVARAARFTWARDSGGGRPGGRSAAVGHLSRSFASRWRASASENVSGPPAGSGATSCVSAASSDTSFTSSPSFAAAAVVVAVTVATATAARPLFATGRRAAPGRG